jgi:hypothetical protein
MSLAKRNYTVGDQEMLAIVMSYRHWRHYLEGARHPVEVLTDHHNLQRFMTTKSLTGWQVDWWETLSGYNLIIVYRAGKSNPADAPSCCPDYEKIAGARCAAMILTARCNTTQLRRQLYAAAVADEDPYQEVPLERLRSLIAEGLKEDARAKEARAVLGLLSGGGPEHSVSALLLRHYQSHWSEQEGLLNYRTLLYVPAEGGARREVLRQHHDDLITGHFGTRRTLELVARKYYWPGMLRDVKAYTKASTCQRIRPVRHHPNGMMEQLPQPRGLWTDISMDFIVGLLESRQRPWGRPYNAILVIVDRYTKMARYFKCCDTIDAAGLAEIIAQKLALRGAGVLLSIVSDRGPQFMSKFWAAFCHHQSIERQLSTAYHLQTDGQTEQQNQTLKQYLRAYVNHLQDDWVHWLPLAKCAYNNSVHASTGLSPFYAEKAHHPEMSECIRDVPADGWVPDVPNARTRAQRVLVIRAVLEKRWKEATATQRKYADRRTKP